MFCAPAPLWIWALLFMIQVFSTACFTTTPWVAWRSPSSSFLQLPSSTSASNISSLIYINVVSKQWMSPSRSGTGLCRWLCTCYSLECCKGTLEENKYKIVPTWHHTKWSRSPFFRVYGTSFYLNAQLCFFIHLFIYSGCEATRTLRKANLITVLAKNPMERRQWRKVQF